MNRGKLVAQGLYRLPSGEWLVLVSAGSRGKRKTVQRVFEHRHAAEEFLRAFRTARIYRAANLPAVDPENAPRTLRWLWSEYDRELRQLSRSEAHRRNVWKAQKLTEAALSPDRPVPLTRQDLVQVAEYARQNTRTEGDAILRAYRLLHAAHRRADLEMARPPDITVERKGRRIMPPETWRAFVQALPAGSVEQLAVMVLFVTGCRESELFALRREDVDLEASAIKIRSRKTGGPPRVIPLDPRVIEMLRPWLDGDGPLLTLDGTSPLAETSLRKRLQAVCRAAKIPAVHSLGWVRNQAATAAVEAGEGLDVASRALGHSDPSITRRHYDRAEMVDARRRFSEARAAEYLEAQDPASGQHQYSTGSEKPPKTPVSRPGGKNKKAR